MFLFYADKIMWKKKNVRDEFVKMIFCEELYGKIVKKVLGVEKWSFNEKLSTC